MSKIDYTIDLMETKDIESLAQLEKLCFSEPWSESALSAELGKDCAIFLVAHNSFGDTLGYMGLNYVLDEGYITNIAVFPAFRNQGIAAALIKAMLDTCKSKALCFVSLEVRCSNFSAINLYKKLGFIEVGKRKNFYSYPTEDGLIMTFYYNKE